ncbi:MAG: CotH kinase family protein [Planctomycetaceae bacterium]
MVLRTLLGVALVGSMLGPAADAAPPGDAFFATARVARIHLTIPRDAFPLLSPGPPGRAGSVADGGPAEVHHNTFGAAQPWTRGTLECDGEVFPDVGLRAKGNYTFMAAARSLRKSLKIDLDRHVESRTLDGLAMLNLHSGVSDHSRAREALSYAAYRACGVPAPRTCFAEVELTVPGLHERVFVGVYTVTEQIDKRFLAWHFGDGGGMLLKPEGLVGGPAWLGNDWAPYAERYRPEKPPKPARQRRLLDFARVVSEADDAEFAARIGDFLDVDAFLGFIAVTALVANLDSYLAYGHNYDLYLDPATDRFAFIPWDLDLSLATWPAAGTPEQLVRLSIDHPHAGDDRLLDRLLAIPARRARYRGLVEQHFATLFRSGLLARELDAIEAALREPLALESLAELDRGESQAAARGPFGGGRFGDSLPPREFIAKRAASVAAQLEGREEGFVPRSVPVPGPPRR